MVSRWVFGTRGGEAERLQLRLRGVTSEASGLPLPRDTSPRGGEGAAFLPWFLLLAPGCYFWIAQCTVGCSCPSAGSGPHRLSRGRRMPLPLPAHSKQPEPTFLI